MAVLDRHHVEYVLVGGYAANLHGAARPTRDARPHRVGGITVHVADLDDIIASKTEAGRAKDLLALPELYQLAALKARGTRGCESG